MRINILSPTGKKLSSTTLPQEVFAAKINKQLMAQAVKVYLSNQRQATKKAKTRGEVTGSTRKIYRQKGTGRARHGDKQAPIFVGGGVAHGPKANQNYKLKLSRKMRRLALFSALSLRAKNKEILLVDKLETLKPKTKAMLQALTKITQSKDKHLPKISLILPQPIKSISLSTANLPSVSLLQANKLNTYQVLKNQYLVFLKPSIKVIQNAYLSKKQK